MGQLTVWVAVVLLRDVNRADARVVDVLYTMLLGGLISSALLLGVRGFRRAEERFGRLVGAAAVFGAVATITQATWALSAFLAR